MADEGPAAGVTVPALDPAALLRTAAEQWADTSRIDFTAWPVRGDRRGDGELLGRALRAWSGPPEGVRVSTTPGTADVPPAQPPRLLFAGEVDGAAVVLFHDGGVRVVRYAEPLSGGGGAALDFARTDDADVTTGAAVVVSRTGEKARFLLAPGSPRPPPATCSRRIHPAVRWRWARTGSPPRWGARRRAAPAAPGRCSSCAPPSGSWRTTRSW
ncbi:hypothetical protein ACN24K_33555 [Streptomyces microflavus]